MNYMTLLMEGMAALATGATSVRLGKYLAIFTHTDGSPVHASFSAILLAVGKALAGQPGSFISGNVGVELTAEVPG